MNSFIFAISAVAPIILMVALGYFLKRIGTVKKELAKPMNRLVFTTLLPVLLFKNIYDIENISSIRLGYILFAVAMTLIFFFLALFVSRFSTDKKNRRGVLVQAVFRSNYALIGIPLAESLYGEGGAALATILMAIIVPLFNILAVIALALYSEEDSKKVSIKKIALDILKNPLIIGISVGAIALLVRYLFTLGGIEFRLSDITPVWKVVGYLASSATPLALIILGVQFEFSAMSQTKRELIWAVLLRCVAVPVIALTTAYLLFDFSGAEFATFVAMFATPIAVSSVPMAQEMKGDAELCGQIVILTTLVSGFTIFLYVFILKSIGVF